MASTAHLRLFFAVELPASVQHALGRLRPSAESDVYRWVDPTMLHLTLAFLGSQPHAALPVLNEIAAATAHSARHTSLTIGSLGSFGPRREPRVLWAGLAGDLEPLHLVRDELVSRLRSQGFEIEERAFSPHITLARRREG